MQPPDDLPLQNDALEPPPPPRREPAVPWTIAALALLAAAALAAFVYLRRPGASESVISDAARSAAQPSATESRGPLGPAVEPRELPPLDLMDPVVRELLGGLSSRPELAAWLAGDELVRAVAAAVDAVANGETPTAQLRRFAPAQPFAVEAQGDQFVVAERSFRRYDGIAQAVASIDAEELARAYSILRPRLQEAYRELGYPDGNFDGALERAITRLLQTPVPERSLLVQPSPVLYKYTDERMERLTAAEKQLLRMGPRNARLVQDKLRELSRALGIEAASAAPR